MRHAAPAEHGSTHFTAVDALLLALLLAAALLWTWRNIHWNAVPVEDAAMLLRYAHNLAGGFGLRWNIHDAPVDGATDFLYAVCVGGIARLSHQSVVVAARALNLIAHLASIAVVYAGSRRLFAAHRFTAAAVAAYLIFGPAWKLTEACFGAPFFAFFLLLSWYFALAFALRGAKWTDSVGFALATLLAGLVRPEGVLVGVLLLLATVAFLARQRRRLLAGTYFVVYALLGGAYFLWHLRYFGYALPNPYYVKGGGHLYPLSMARAASHMILFLGPVLPLLALGYVRPANRPAIRAIVAILACFTAMWLLVADWNNHYFRFQYAVVPLSLLSAAGATAGLHAHLRWSLPQTTRAARTPLLAAGLLYCLFAFAYIDRAFYPPENTAAGMRLLAQRLQPLASRGYTMAVTEAGALPFYSEWQTIDVLGLNDAIIAHGGSAAIPGYLEARHPELIMVHADGFGNDMLAQLALSADDAVTTDNKFEAASRFARQHNYELAAAYGEDACNLHVFWVRRDFPDSDRVLKVLRSSPYYFLDSGVLTHDFRNDPPPTIPCKLS